MKELTRNIINAYGKKGQNWLNELPSIVENLQSYWHLKNIAPVDNMSFNYVAKAISSLGQPVVLKISCDQHSITEEKAALTYFNGDASIQLIDDSEKYNALLLEQAIPGITLTSLYPEKLEFVMESYVNTIHKLHDKRLPSTHQFRHVQDWLKSIDNANSEKIPMFLLKKALQLKKSLLESSKSQVFLHGDLHHDNILQHQDAWVAIDPKGIIGEPEFEIAAFDFMYVNELANTTDVKTLFEKRIDLLARKAHLDANRIKDWVFVRLILMAAWSIEDGGDPSWAVKLAELLV